jgi:hypothetical protein
MKYRPGDLVMNAGRCAGYGYVWRIESVHATNPYQPSDKRPMVHARCLRPLRGKPEPMDSWIGGRVCDLASRFQPFIGDQPVQMGLL